MNTNTHGNNNYYGHWYWSNRTEQAVNRIKPIVKDITVNVNEELFFCSVSSSIIGAIGISSYRLECNHNEDTNIAPSSSVSS